MPFILLAAVVLTQTPARPPDQPGVAVMVSRRAGLTVQRADELARDVQAALAAHGVPVTGDSEVWARKAVCADQPEPASCDGDTACLAALAKKLGVPVVVGVEAGVLGEDLALHLTALDATSGKLVADKTVTAEAASLRARLGPELAEFATAVTVALPKRASAPPAPVVAPGPPVEQRAPAPGGGLRAWAWAPAAGGAALGAGGLYFLGQAAARSATLRGEGSAQGIGLEQATRLREEGKAAQTTGVALLGGAAAALATSGAMVLFGGPEKVRVSVMLTPGQVGAAAAITLP